MIGIWTLSYMDREMVDRFLRWCRDRTEYLLLVEPTSSDDHSKGYEHYLDKAQQLINRHYDAYEKKFVEHGLRVLH